MVLVVFNVFTHRLLQTSLDTWSFRYWMRLPLARSLSALDLRFLAIPGPWWILEADNTQGPLLHAGTRRFQQMGLPTEVQ